VYGAQFVALIWCECVFANSPLIAVYRTKHSLFQAGTRHSTELADDAAKFEAYMVEVRYLF